MGKYKYSDPVIRQLHGLLVSHFPLTTTIIKILNSADFKLINISLQGTVGEIWHSILIECLKQERLNSLLHSVSEEAQTLNKAELTVFVENRFNIRAEIPLMVTNQPGRTSPTFDKTPTSIRNRSLSDFFYLECDRVEQMQTLDSLLGEDENKLNVVFIHGCHDDMHLYLIDRFLTETSRKTGGKPIFPYRNIRDHNYAIEVSEEGSKKVRWDKELAEYYKIRDAGLIQQSGPDFLLSRAKENSSNILLSVVKIHYKGKDFSLLQNFLDFWKDTQASSVTIFLFICIVYEKKGFSFGNPVKKFKKNANKIIDQSIGSSNSNLQWEVVELTRFEKSLIKQFMAKKKIRAQIKDPRTHDWLSEQFESLQEKVSMVDAIEFLNKVHSTIS